VSKGLILDRHAEVTSGDHRTGAHAFYQAHGYAPEERHFLKRYDGTSGM
jgi:hypothetical protein